MIAVIDDDASVRRSVSNLLESLGFGVRGFDSAERFLESDMSAAECLVLDVQLAAMSGLELLAELRRMALPIGIVLLSAHDNDEMRRRALEFGASAFLSKPFRSEELVRAVTALAGFST